MPILLPFRPSIPQYRFRTAILGAEYRFDVRFNTRLDLYFVDVADVKSVPIVVGIPIVLGAFLGRSSSHTLFQSGVMLARNTDATQPGKEARFADLGERVQVSYWPRDDMAAEVLARLSPAT
jgi:hypothetical protein